MTKALPLAAAATALLVSFPVRAGCPDVCTIESTLRFEPGLECLEISSFPDTCETADGPACAIAISVLNRCAEPVSGDPAFRSCSREPDPSAPNPIACDTIAFREIAHYRVNLAAGEAADEGTQRFVLTHAGVERTLDVDYRVVWRQTEGCSTGGGSATPWAALVGSFALTQLRWRKRRSW